MEKRELYDKFEELSQNLMSMLAEVEAIKANFSGIFEENTALKLENDKLREHLSQVIIMKLVDSVQNCCTEIKHAGSKEF